MPLKVAQDMHNLRFDVMMSSGAWQCKWQQSGLPGDLQPYPHSFHLGKQAYCKYVIKEQLLDKAGRVERDGRDGPKKPLLLCNFHWGFYFYQI